MAAKLVTATNAALGELAQRDVIEAHSYLPRQSSSGPPQTTTSSCSARVSSYTVLSDSGIASRGVPFAVTLSQDPPVVLEY